MEQKLFYEIDQAEREHWWFNGRRKIIESILKRYAALPSDATILDVGCGTGANFECLSRFGTVTGLERDETAIRIAREKKNSEVITGSLPDNLPFPQKRFDLITLLDVLEHVENDEAALSALTPLLRPGGHFLITVPAFQWMWSEHDKVNHHHRRYRLPQLREKLLKLNLRIEMMSYFNFFLFPVIAGLRFLKFSTDLKVPPKPVNMVLTALFSSEKKLIGRIPFPFGVSIAACASKL